MKIHYRLLFVALLGTMASYAQTAAAQSGNAAQNNMESLAAGAPTVIPRGSADGVKGSPYLDNRWLMTRMRMTNNLLLEPVAAKYDVLNNRVLIKPVDRPTDSLQLNARLLAGFEIQEPGMPGQPNYVRKFRRFTEAPAAAQQAEYVEVIHSGKVELLKSYIKIFHKANFQGAYSSGNRYDEIEDKAQYFVKRSDGVLVPVKLTQKGLQAAVPELASAIKASPEAGKAKTDAEWAAVLRQVDPQ